MNKPIHPPKLIKSIDGMGLPQNKRELNLVTANIGVTTELWAEVNKPWSESGTIIALPGYQWITEWHVGRNYLETRIVDTNGELVGIYCDISSPVRKTLDGFEVDDWYLDIWQESGKAPIILDEDELVLALDAGHLTLDEATIARNTAEMVVSLLSNSKA